MPPPPLDALTRRDALRALGGALVSPLLLRCGEERAPLHTRIDTVVVLMLENRSFDHYFGALSLIEGRADVDGLRPDMHNLRHDGTKVAVHPAPVRCVEDPPHSWESSHAQWNGGANDGFVREYESVFGLGQPAHAMGFLTRADLPVAYALADGYALCQRWFSSLMTSTWPNRLYVQAAQSGGAATNVLPDTTMDTIYGRLTKAGLSWGSYAGNLPFVALVRDVPPRGFQYLEDFFTDAAAGALPSLSVVEPYYGRNDDHPPRHPLAGQLLVASVYDALARSPQWGRSMLFITYDEHGGFFDHVPPPTAADDRAELGFDQLGFRVPALAVGPYVRRGHVSSTIYDHTSVLAFVEHLFGLAPLTARDAAANDVTDVLDEARLRDRAPREAEALAPLEVSEEDLRGPGCREPTSTGQPELEAWAGKHPLRATFDKRAGEGERYERFLEHVARRELWRPRGARVPIA